MNISELSKLLDNGTTKKNTVKSASLFNKVVQKNTLNKDGNQNTQHSAQEQERMSIKEGFRDMIDKYL